MNFIRYDWANIDGLNGGLNNTANSGNGFDFSYEAAFAVADNQWWFGPYGTIAGEL